MKLFDDQYIIVTGGSGFIGSQVIKALNDKGFNNIVVVDHLGQSSKWTNLVTLKFAEILDKGQLFDWLQSKDSEVSTIIHLGACSATTEMNAGYLLENNYRYSKKLAEWALKNEVRFIYASSAATYGDGALGFSDDHALLPSLKPLNMYGYSKHLFDLWAQNEGVLDKLVGLKYFNVFGPNEGHKGRMASAIFHFVPQILKEKKVRLFKSSDPENYGDGGQLRDFIYVKDAAKMTIAFLENEAGGIYNIGTGVPRTWRSLAESVFSALDLDPEIEFIPMPDDLIGKYQNYTAAEMEKTRSILGNLADCAPLEKTVDEYVRCHLSDKVLCKT